MCINFQSSASQLSGPQAVVLAACVLLRKYDLRSRVTDYIVVVASSDSVMRFYDMDKLHVQAQVRS
jgi:hypothetical protein